MPRFTASFAVLFLAAGALLASPSPVRADVKPTMGALYTALDTRLTEAMNGVFSTTASPAGMDYNDYMEKEGAVAKDLIQHYMATNRSSSADEIDDLTLAARGHQINAAETWMAVNADKLGDLTYGDWLTMERLRGGLGISSQELETMEERALDNYFTHHPEERGKRPLR